MEHRLRLAAEVFLQLNLLANMESKNKMQV